ncbi:hypothetical protein TRIUR3_20452 [Triticum urartu]|uniref:Uncharacterized protein n=1 Tax=Triticum urartu TaxID=4572 RepID=M7YUP1_TRIUA|nr:hypothetical protein TRIUR3_20452 [Triticum urartu]
MDIYSAVFVFCVYAVGTMEVQVLSAMALARRKAAPPPTASKLGRMLGSSLCVFVATYFLVHGTLSVLVPCHFQCFRVRIAALVAGVVDLAVTASIMPPNKWLLLPNISWTKLKKKRRTAMKPLPVSVALLALFLAASYQDLAVAAGADGGGGGVPVPDGVCEGKCKNRCSQKVAGRCMGLCMMCCGKCAGCVPLGPLAPKDECPCYRDMKSPKSGRPKCP